MKVSNDKLGQKIEVFEEKQKILKAEATSSGPISVSLETLVERLDSNFHLLRFDSSAENLPFAICRIQPLCQGLGVACLFKNPQMISLLLAEVFFAPIPCT